MVDGVALMVGVGVVAGGDGGCVPVVGPDAGMVVDIVVGVGVGFSLGSVHPLKKMLVTMIITISIFEYALCPGIMIYH
ncbi:MAG TPA: hypothetical protein PLI31_00250 [Methanoregulaceae archaeon]|nr:hypothetical protein [Methanoregulaceae archaeon]